MNGLKRFLKDKNYILEAGCGLARDSAMFSDANPEANVLGVDQSASAIKVARKYLKKWKNCKVERADITNFASPNKFDFISCDQVIHHTPDPGKTLAHLYKKLNPGGIINFSVCRKKSKAREFADDLIMDHAPKMSPEELWNFSIMVTKFAKSLHELGIKDVSFEGKKYGNLQFFIHNHLFRVWYRPDIPFDLSVSNNYDWFSGNPRFNAEEVRSKMLSKVPGCSILRFFEDDATISVSLKKGA